MPSITELQSEEERKLSRGRRLIHGLGHVNNDLCVSIWLSYLLISYQNVLLFSNTMAGNMMLIGQVTDAITTPLIGIGSDKINGMCGYGKRKSWHLLGEIYHL